MSLLSEETISGNPINVWPNTPPALTTLGTVIPAYLYQQYFDDNNLQAFFASYNGYAQSYINDINSWMLPVYANNPRVVGPVLDWVAAGLYGFIRPVLASGQQKTIGAYATTSFASIAFAYTNVTGGTTIYGTSDDIFCRILTWHLYKGDGKQYSILWLKRRIMRFLYGVNGSDFIIDNTYPVSISIASNNVTITLTGTPSLPSSIFQAAVAQGVLELPPFDTYTVTLA